MPSLRPRLHASAAAFLATSLLLSAPAFAATKDAAVEKAIQKALDEDYLETKFDAAEKRLRAAIDSCGSDGCSPAVKAKAYFALGGVLAGGKKALEDGRDVFVEALKLDPKGKPPSELASTEVNYAYGEARKILKLDKATPEPAASGMEHLPHPEQAKNAPVPIYVVVTGEAAKKVDKVRVTYRPPGAKASKTQNLRALGGGAFATNIPCADTGELGAIEYYVTAIDADQRVVASAGSESKPLSTQIKESIAGSAPHWPGYEPPKSCSDDAPKKLDGQACRRNSDCGEGMRCSEQVCVPKPPKDKPEPKEKEPRRNWFTLTFTPDLPIFDGTDVCSPGQRRDETNVNAGYACQRSDGSPYVGTPTPGQGNNIALGFVVGTMRVVLGYDRLIGDALTVGARVGVSFNGAPANFIPVHAEARIAYHFGSSPFLSQVRPFLFASGGLAQMDPAIEVEKLEDGAVCGAANPLDSNSPCTIPSSDGRVEDRVAKLKAYRQLGPGFAGAGVGLVYTPVPMFGLHLAARGVVTFPVVAAAILPEVGVTVGF